MPSRLGETSDGIASMTQHKHREQAKGLQMARPDRRVSAGGLSQASAKTGQAPRTAGPVGEPGTALQAIAADPLGGRGPRHAGGARRGDHRPALFRDPATEQLATKDVETCVTMRHEGPPASVAASTPATESEDPHLCQQPMWAVQLVCALEALKQRGAFLPEHRQVRSRHAKHRRVVHGGVVMGQDVAKADDHAGMRDLHE